MRQAILITVLMGFVIMIGGFWVVPEVLAQAPPGAPAPTSITMWQTIKWGGTIGFLIIGRKGSP